MGEPQGEDPLTLAAAVLWTVLQVRGCEARRQPRGGAGSAVGWWTHSDSEVTADKPAFTRQREQDVMRRNREYRA